ncbi:anaerobic magnesium-protoporphyrin IX monomethyl ester cyclase [Methanolinea mesophila]|uniref:B12-binding domain-containing radical SAM protein n=1 Tax=Methanolinea mesophila TaxID=547055 RepID=UPI001AE7FFD3|nr:radical SAM protein [Methanolinea mesophila]MBP1930002.1 anaerobic magnesium-protoporphyrin IX monomethyl ester cyclase [Methanolinea mesophila]
MPDRIALIYPFFREKDPVEEEKLFPPLSVAYLSAQMKERGLSVSVHDGTFLAPAEVVRNVTKLRPAVVSIYLMITMGRNALNLLGQLRALLPGTLFIAGGPLATLYPERFGEPFDIVFCGEGDRTVARFCADYCRSGCRPDDLSRLDLSTYPGLSTRLGDAPVRVPPVHLPAEEIERLPLPDRSVFDHRRYQEFWQDAAGCRMTSIMITRGCPYSCDFCSKPVWGNEYRRPSLVQVFREIRDILSYGYDRIWIADDSFTLDTSYLEEFCRRKIAGGFSFTWTCLSRVDRLDEEIVGLMKDAGCVRVHLGLESGNDATLGLMGKRIKVADGIRAVRLFCEAGIGTAGFFIVGYPGETEESVDQTLALAATLPLDEISINVPFPLPGSPLFTRVVPVDTTADWQVANEISFIYDSEFDESWLRDRIGRAKERFRENREKRRKGRSDTGNNP